MGREKDKLTEQMLGISSGVVTCAHCGKSYRQDVQDQTPGFRDWEYDICPYCNAENGKSMSEEYYNYPLQ